MQKSRIVFTKINRAIYISHLDLMRSMQRALKRSGLPIKYTEGFNPHIYIMFPLPLSLGVSSRCEIMDVEFNADVSENVIKDSLNKVLPEDIQVVSILEQTNKHTEITYAEYKVILKTGNTEEILNNLLHFFNSDEILIEKMCKFHGKKVMKTFDIKSDIKVINVTNIENRECVCNINLPAGVIKTINPNTLFDKFKSDFNCREAMISIERTKILCSDSKDFA